MKLRWVEGNFEHGKFKLQYECSANEWVDVPSVKDVPVKWCLHMGIFKNVDFKDKTGKTYLAFCGEEWMFCPVCGAVKP